MNNFFLQVVKNYISICTELNNDTNCQLKLKKTNLSILYSISRKYKHLQHCMYCVFYFILF